MDLNEFRAFILDSGLDVWTWIDMAISVASHDHENELKSRRDQIVQKLYAPAFSRCQNCDRNAKESEENETFQQKQDMGSDHNSEGLSEDDVNDDDDELREILEIKILLDDQNQSEGALIELLQKLVDMDTTFKALKETDIGRQVTRLRKHSSNEVRRLVKILVRKWKGTVDEWVRLNTPTEEATQFNGDDKKSPHEAHHENIQDEVIHHADAQNTSVSCYLTPVKGKMKHNQIESEKPVLATKCLHDQNYHEGQRAKKHKTAQVTNFHNIPKTKNAIVMNNGGGFTMKSW
ncbi:hypothetical protein CDL12_04123 [Handroanthus impetiginosus]|uniref:TFIIS N-terminal domain-containing protein n=1 Tax=Handroanthus impetiginosus TaxID=429701 RepID=A0A2G9I072_9LAMI|nr:hypothetical protein CDL12_04123 [Handroanthus impetiginosus]